MFCSLFLFLNASLCTFIPQIPLQVIKGSRLVSQHYPELRTVLLIILNNEPLLKSFYSSKDPSALDDPKVGYWYNVLKLAIWKAQSSDAILDLDRLVENSKAEATKRETSAPSEPGEAKKIVDFNPIPPFFKDLLDGKDILLHGTIFDEAGKKYKDNI